MRLGWRLLLVLALAFMGRSGVTGTDKPPAGPSAERPKAAGLLTQEASDAIRRGLNWIASQQNQKGHWPESEWSLAISSLAGLALAAKGPSHRGKVTRSLLRFTDYVLDHAGRNGLIHSPGNSRPALGQGFALLFLTQVYGMFDQKRDERIQEVLRKGIKYILDHQTVEGGWYENYGTNAAHYWIITVSQIQALRAARRCGFAIPKTPIRKAVAFVDKTPFCTCSEPCYGNDAARLVTLIAAGDYKNESLVPRGRKLLSDLKYDFKKLSYPVYTHLYAAQALHYHGGREWTSYYEQIRDTLVRTQKRPRAGHGYWDRQYRGHSRNKPGKVYATAVACLILQIPYRTLPMLNYK